MLMYGTGFLSKDNRVVLCSRSIASRADCSIALYSMASHSNSRITSAARICVASSFSLNMSQNLERMPSGGPPSIMLRSSSGRPIDISCAREGGLDKATYIYIRFDLRRQTRHAKKEDYPDIRIFGSPDIRAAGYRDTRLAGNPDIRVSGNPAAWKSAYLAGRKFG